MTFKDFCIKKNDNIWTILLATIGNMIFCLCLIISLMLIFFSSVTIECSVSGGSMRPTYNADVKKEDDIVFANTLDKTFEFGDIVVISVENKKNPIIKRIVGLPGDVIDIVEYESDKYALEINGEIIEEKYVNITYDESVLIHDFDFNGMRLTKDHLDDLKKSKPKLFNAEGKVVVGEGKVFVLGDNRHNSLDSTYYGTFDMKNIKGTVERSLNGGDSKILFYWDYIVKGKFFETIGNCF